MYVEKQNLSLHDLKYQNIHKKHISNNPSLATTAS